MQQVTKPKGILILLWQFSWILLIQKTLVPTQLFLQEAEGDKMLALVNEELERKLNQTTEMEKKIVELENQLKLASAKSEEQLKEATQAELKGVEMKSRDLGSAVSTPSKRKSKKKPEAASAQAGDVSSAVPAQSMEGSSLSMNIKFILGVALVSVVIGVILGKRY